MKKLIALILALLMLCSCSVQEEPVIEEPQSETENEVKIEILDEVSYLGENGKYGFHKDGVPVTEAVYDEILPVDKIEGSRIYKGFHETENGKKVFAGIITDGTRKDVKEDWELGAHYIEIPNSLYWFYEAGSDCLINETPLGNFSLLRPGEQEYDFYFIRGAYDGDYYAYIRNSDGTWELHEKQSGSPGSAYMDEFFITGYYWSWVDKRYGIEDMEGNTVIEPIYYFGEHNLNRKFIVYDGFSSATWEDTVRTYIIDWEGNVINDEYTYIQSGVYETGKFVLAAAKLNKDSGRYEWCFIDDEGNKLSESFESIMLVWAMHEEEYGYSYWHKTAIVTKDGIQTEISLEEYAWDYE